MVVKRRPSVSYWCVLVYAYEVYDFNCSYCDVVGRFFYKLIPEVLVFMKLCGGKRHNLKVSFISPEKLYVIIARINMILMK